MERIKTMSGGDAGTYGELLPDIADFFTHKAYQESFLINREYRFPGVGERAGVSSYTSTEGQGVAKSFQEMLVFSTEWFDQTLDAEESQGLLGLWLRQGNPVGTRMNRQVNVVISGSVLFRHIVLCLIICLPMLFMNNRLTPQLMYGIKSLTLRRKRQAA